MITNLLKIVFVNIKGARQEIRQILIKKSKSLKRWIFVMKQTQNFVRTILQYITYSIYTNNYSY